MLTNPSDKSQLSVNLFITFLFVVFFFQFFRNFILEKPMDKQMLLIQTILIMLWYGFSIMI